MSDLEKQVADLKCQIQVLENRVSGHRYAVKEALSTLLLELRTQGVAVNQKRIWNALLDATFGGQEND